MTSIAKTLHLPAIRISQLLALLRAHRLVDERRAGRNHFYHPSHPHVADWILDALQFVDIRNRLAEGDHIDSARALRTAKSHNQSH